MLQVSLVCLYEKKCEKCDSRVNEYKYSSTLVCVFSVRPSETNVSTPTFFPLDSLQKKLKDLEEENKSLRSEVHIHKLLQTHRIWLAWLAHSGIVFFLYCMFYANLHDCMEMFVSINYKAYAVARQLISKFKHSFVAF